jgi:integrase
MTPAPKSLKRTVGKPLTTAAIAAMKPGQLLADGGIDTGAGRLKLRKRQTQTGSVSEWLYIYWGGEKGKRVTILLNGKASRYSPKEQEGYLTIAQAREIARKLQADVHAGTDPAIQRELEKASTQKAQAAAINKLKDSKAKTLEALMDAYVSSLEAKGKAKSAYDVENLVKNHISTPFPALAVTPASDVSALDVSKILARLVGPDVAVKKGRTALKLRSYMAAAFKLAMGAELDPMAPLDAVGFELKVNPAAAVPATKMAAAYHSVGERTLSVDELHHYLRRLEALPSEMHRLALELQIMAGGQRMQQLLRLTRADLSTETFTLYDPKGKRAQPRTHVLPLLPELSERIEKLKELSPVSERNVTGSLFASTGGSVINAETLSGVVQKISKDMVAAKESATPFRGGDIRRTCETMMAGALGIHKDTRAQLLSHGLSGVQDKVYDKGSHLSSKTVALQAWNGYLNAVRQGQTKASNVVQLNAA